MFKVYFLFILFSTNNIFITITNSEGEVISWKSLGNFKTKGLKKLTPSILKNLIKNLFNFIELKNFKVHIKFKGFNKLKKNLIKNLTVITHPHVLSITDNSLQPNNGCKLKKYRRL